MANEVLGRTATLSVVADATRSGSGDVAPVAKLTDLSINANADEIDITSYDSAGYRDYIKGAVDLTCDFSFIFADVASPAQKDIIHSWNNHNAANSASAGGFLEFEIVLATDMKIAGFMLITSLSISTGLDDVQRVDCSARLCDVNTSSEWDFIG